MFGITDYPAFCLAVLVFLALPGPGTLALLTATGQGGLRAATATTLGLIAGDQVLMWLALAGVAAVLKAHPTLFLGIQYLGAAYLCWIGLRLILARSAGTGGVLRLRPRHYARQAFFITLLNPKAIVFYMAFLPLFIDPARHQGLTTFLAMAITIAVLTALYCLALAASGHILARHLRKHPRIGPWLQRVAGGLLVVFGIRLASG